MKYVITDTTRCEEGVLLHQIRAAQSFKIHNVNGNRIFATKICKRELGGWIESSSNLSQNGSCWINENAAAYGNSLVTGGALLDGCAKIYDNAIMSDNSLVTGNARVYDNAKIHDIAVVRHCARIFDNASIGGMSDIKDNARVFGDATVLGACTVCDDATIKGKTSLSGMEYVGGRSVIDGTMIFNTTNILNDVQLDEPPLVMHQDGVNYVFYRHNNGQIQMNISGVAFKSIDEWETCMQKCGLQEAEKARIITNFVRQYMGELVQS